MQHFSFAQVQAVIAFVVVVCIMCNIVEKYELLSKEIERIL